jgi:Uma2 family endonuclease
MAAMPTNSPADTMLLRDWERLRDPPSGRLELHAGQIVVSPAPRIMHQDVVWALVFALRQQCPTAFAVSSDIEWRWLVGGRSIRDALRPDVIVFDRVFRSDVALTAAPHLAVEVLSPGNTRAEMARKRRLYLANGLENYAEVAISNEDATVTIVWFRAHDGAWVEVAQATGADELTVDDPFPIRIVPNTLLD